jgi:hypothetical protein
MEILWRKKLDIQCSLSPASGKVRSKYISALQILLCKEKTLDEHFFS